MNSFFTESVFFGAVVTILCYEIGLLLRDKVKKAICNPMLIALIAIIAILLLFHVDYETYYEGAKYLSYFLTPATVCLAIPLYEQIELLKKNVKAIVAGVTAGVLTSMLSVLGCAAVFQLSQKEYLSFLPKSVTTAIGMGISEELGGMVTLTVVVIMITGIAGAIVAELVMKLFRIKEPIAKGIGIGSASHVVGTAKAMEMGRLEGAMSSLSIAVSGVLTVIAASVFAGLY